MTEHERTAIMLAYALWIRGGLVTHENAFTAGWNAHGNYKPLAEPTAREDKRPIYCTTCAEMVAIGTVFDAHQWHNLTPIPDAVEWPRL